MSRTSGRRWGLEPLSGWQKVGTIAGMNDYGKHGYIGDVGINGKGYGVSHQGGVIGGRTSLTPNEARTRSQIAAGLAKQAIEAAARGEGGGKAAGPSTTGRGASSLGRRDLSSKSPGNAASREGGGRTRDSRESASMGGGRAGGGARGGMGGPSAGRDGGGRSRDGRESDRMGGDRMGGGARGGMGGPR